MAAVSGLEESLHHFREKRAQAAPVHQLIDDGNSPTNE
jgi:hypothetical protein